MKKYSVLMCALLLMVGSLQAQDGEESTGGFKSENLFTGGSLSFGFSNRSFLIGVNPVFGYSIARWIDAGLVGNYNYGSYKSVAAYNDRLKQYVYGGGLFTRIYPVRFIFLQAQVEHNFIKQNYTAAGGAYSETSKVEASSFLVGAGYTTNRDPDSGSPFFYFSVMFDLGKETYSPYKDSEGRTIPILRGGIQIPLFQKRYVRDME